MNRFEKSTARMDPQLGQNGREAIADGIWERYRDGGVKASDLPELLGFRRDPGDDGCLPIDSVVRLIALITVPITWNQGFRYDIFECRRCGYRETELDWAFCPSCGSLIVRDGSDGGRVG